ncbi:hypothetical protein VTL71DRAFT_10424, partial [Oculimacula yallundae]
MIKASDRHSLPRRLTHYIIDLDRWYCHAFTRSPRQSIVVFTKEARLKSHTQAGEPAMSGCLQIASELRCNSGLAGVGTLIPH